MNDDYTDAHYLVDRVETARGYADYVPDEEMVGEPESDRFESVLDDIIKALRMMDAEELEQWQEEYDPFEEDDED